TDRHAFGRDQREVRNRDPICRARPVLRMGDQAVAARRVRFYGALKEMSEWRATMGVSSLYAELDRRAGEVADQVVRWRHHLHAHPELSNREVNTAALIADQLRSLGLDEVRTGIAGHGIVGILRGGRPGERVVALR